MGFTLDMDSLDLNLVLARKEGKEPFKVFRGRAVKDCYDSVTVGPPKFLRLPSGPVRTVYVITLGAYFDTWPGPAAMLILVDNGKFYETHSFIQENMRGKGLGIALYSAAIEVAKMRNIRIGSSTTPSKDAVRLWNSTRLREAYDISYTESGVYRVAI